MATAASASRTNGRPASTSEWTAIVRTPSRCAVRMIRRAISPRLAMRREWIMRHIRNTPNCARSGIGAFSVADSARPSTSRVWAGSMMPSSHSRAVA